MRCRFWGAPFRWLIEQRYVLANPFAGVKVREASGASVLDTSHAFSEGEWALVRTIADGLEWLSRCQPDITQRRQVVVAAFVSGFWGEAECDGCMAPDR
ncbi:hypothetical protein OKW46_000685 [Paraburkholderia sp. WSM4179]|nr:hypothetical protein [Paraburkholderia sp. WSM4179]